MVVVSVVVVTCESANFISKCCLASIIIFILLKKSAFVVSLDQISCDKFNSVAGISYVFSICCICIM